MNDQNRPKNGAVGDKIDVIMVCAGSVGVATACGLVKRDKTLSIAIVDPSTDHYYQPGWAMVGGGIFDPVSTHRETARLIPDGVKCYSHSVTSFLLGESSVQLDDG